MHKNFVAGLIARLVPHTGCGPNSFYTSIKLC